VKQLIRRVVFRDPHYTEMSVPDSGGARAFARQLIRGGKGFRCEPCPDGSWTFTINEPNEPNRWEA
jgi:hypothetical protein